MNFLKRFRFDIDVMGQVFSVMSVIFDHETSKVIIERGIKDEDFSLANAFSLMNPNDQHFFINLKNESGQKRVRYKLRVNKWILEPPTLDSSEDVVAIERIHIDYDPLTTVRSEMTKGD